MSILYLIIKIPYPTRIRDFVLFREINYLSAACAAASLAIGTLNGEQDT